MKSLSHFMRQLLVFVFVGIFALLSVLQLMERGAIPWISITGIGVIIAILAGPVVWLLRDHYSEQHRERLALVAFGVVMIAAPITLGLALAFGVPSYVPPFQALIVGGFIGFVVAFITEHTVVPRGYELLNKRNVPHAEILLTTNAVRLRRTVFDLCRVLYVA